MSDDSVQPFDITSYSLPDATPDDTVIKLSGIEDRRGWGVLTYLAARSNLFHRSAGNLKLSGYAQPENIRPVPIESHGGWVVFYRLPRATTHLPILGVRGKLIQFHYFIITDDTKNCTQKQGDCISNNLCNVCSFNFRI